MECRSQFTYFDGCDCCDDSSAYSSLQVPLLQGMSKYKGHLKINVIQSFVRRLLIKSYITQESEPPSTDLICTNRDSEFLLVNCLTDRLTEEVWDLVAS